MTVLGSGRTRTPTTAGSRDLIGGFSRPGRSRTENMDAWHAGPATTVIADGMGSTRHGGDAARLAVEVLTATLGDGLVDEARLRAGIADVQREVVTRFNHDVAAGGPLQGASTLCVLTTDGQDRLVASIGDSRVQVLRAGAVRALTDDHTVAAHLVAVGATEPDSPLARRTANHLRRYVGNPAGAEPDVLRVRPHDGDVWLLSTDGVHDVLGDDELGSLLAGGGDPETIARRLCEAAEAAGGTDDATAVVILDVRRPGPPEAHPSQEEPVSEAHRD